MALRVYSEAAIKFDKQNSRDSKQTLLNVGSRPESSLLVVSCMIPGSKSAVYDYVDVLMCHVDVVRRWRC